MRTHLQGITLLALLLAAVWGAVQLASPALSSALGEDGAVVAESSDDRIDLTADSEPEAPLTDPEKLRLQFNLQKHERTRFNPAGARAHNVSRKNPG